MSVYSLVCSAPGTSPKTEPLAVATAFSGQQHGWKTRNRAELHADDCHVFLRPYSFRGGGGAAASPIPLQRGKYIFKKRDCYKAASFQTQRTLELSSKFSYFQKRFSLSADDSIKTQALTKPAHRY